MTDKNAIEILAGSAIHPKDLKAQVIAVLSIDANDLASNVVLLKKLFQETLTFAKGMYKPYYKL